MATQSVISAVFAAYLVPTDCPLVLSTLVLFHLPVKEGLLGVSHVCFFGGSGCGALVLISTMRGDGALTRPCASVLFVSTRNMLS